jgi:hypothetical protein
MPRIVIADGDTPDGSDLDVISRQSISTMTLAAMLGLTPAPSAGEVVFTTDMGPGGAYFGYNGSDWVMFGQTRRVGCRLTRNALQAWTDGYVDMAIDWDTYSDDTDGFVPSLHGGSPSNTDTVTVPTGFDGLYIVNGFAYTSTPMNALIPGFIKIFQNGGGGFDAMIPASGTRGHVSSVCNLSAGDDIQLVVAQDTIPMDVTARLQMYRLGP